jgi:hypothetical protein
MLDRLRQRERLIILPSPSPTGSSRLSARANAVHARSTPEASLGGLGALSERARFDWSAFNTGADTLRTLLSRRI